MVGMTELQRQFAKSRLFRDQAYLLLFEVGYARGNDKRLLKGILSDVFADIPEAEIKYFLLHALQCYDITDQERNEAVGLLQLAETALTARQREKIKERLEE